uniref:Anaphase-promoting complex subunit CDC26 n=1 Tax=Strigamia maritima TaxID=126957 RepID=T1JM24_STRMM
MIRRNPTRIELKMDDFREYETKKKEMEGKKLVPKANDLAEMWESVQPKTKQEIINERIGYQPQPRLPN